MKFRLLVEVAVAVLVPGGFGLLLVRAGVLWLRRRRARTIDREAGKAFDAAPRSTAAGRLPMRQPSRH